MSNSLHLAVGVLILAFVIGWYVQFQTERIHRNHLLISTGLERVQKYNAALSNALTIAVLERNILRAASYATLNAQLDATLGEVGALAAELGLAGEVLALREERGQLQRTEDQVLELMRNDQWSDAARMLSEDDYQMNRKIYEINTDTAVGALSGEMDALVGRFERLSSFIFVLWVGAIVLLLWAGASYSRRLHRELAEQGQLREALSSANEVLEEKVRERTRLLESANVRLEALSVTDGLTGLANRRKLDDYLELTWAQALRQQHQLAVLMIDVDHFKAYNDHYGHQMGDACLQLISQILNAELRRAGELAGRYGGEEFIIVLPYASANEAALSAEWVRQQVEAAQIPHAASAVAGVVTISIGVAAHIPVSGETVNLLIESADRALYQAKHAGRNRVVLAGGRNPYDSASVQPDELQQPRVNASAPLCIGSSVRADKVGA